MLPCTVVGIPATVRVRKAGISSKISRRVSRTTLRLIRGAPLDDSELLEVFLSSAKISACRSLFDVDWHSSPSLAPTAGTA